MQENKFGMVQGNCQRTLCLDREASLCKILIDPTLFEIDIRGRDAPTTLSEDECFGRKPCGTHELWYFSAHQMVHTPSVILSQTRVGDVYGSDISVSYKS